MGALLIIDQKDRPKPNPYPYPLCVNWMFLVYTILNGLNRLEEKKKKTAYSFICLEIEKHYTKQY